MNPNKTNKSTKKLPIFETEGPSKHNENAKRNVVYDQLDMSKSFNLISHEKDSTIRKLLIMQVKKNALFEDGQKTYLTDENGYLSRYNDFGDIRRTQNRPRVLGLRFRYRY